MEREKEMNGETEKTDERNQTGNDPEAEIILEILRQINAELDEIAERLEEIGTID